MRTNFLFILGSLLILSLATDNCLAHKSYTVYTCKSLCLEDIDIDIENGALILTNKYDRDDVVKITEDYDLYVNGKYISTDYRQDILIKDYYKQFINLIDYAKELGWEGARVGVEGAKVGLKAAAGLLKVIFTKYEAEELEEYIEEQAEELEDRAEELKEKAEEIEEMADEFEDLHHELKENIPELKRLKWF